MKDTKNLMNTLVIALTVVAIAGIAGYVILQKKAVPSQSKQAGLNSSDKVPAIKPFLATAGWKNYRNDNLGFEVKYPGGWFFEPHLNSGYFDISSRKIGVGTFGAVKGQATVRISVYKGVPYKNAGDWFENDQKKLGKYIYSDMQEIVLDGHKALKAKTTYPDQGSGGNEIRIIYKGTGYILGYKANQENSTVATKLDLIIDSFKFTK